MKNTLNLPHAVAIALDLVEPATTGAKAQNPDDVQRTVETGPIVPAYPNERVEGYILWSPERNKQHMEVYALKELAEKIANEYASKHGFTYYVCSLGTGFVKTDVKQTTVVREETVVRDVAVVRI